MRVKITQAVMSDARLKFVRNNITKVKNANTFKKLHSIK